MRTKAAPSPKIPLSMTTLPVFSISELAPPVVTGDGEDVEVVAFEVVDGLTELVDDTVVVAVEFFELDTDGVDEAEELEEAAAEDEAEVEVDGGLLEDELELELLEPDPEPEPEPEPDCGLRTPPCNLPADDEEDVPAALDWYEDRELPEAGGLITPTIPL